MSNLSFGKKKKRIQINYELLLKIFGWTFQIVLVCFLAFLIVWFFGQRVGVLGDSMKPKMKNGDTALINTLVYETRKPKRGDVIAFWPNGNKSSHCYIKRVIGLPGETISYADGKIMIDDEPLTKEFQSEEIGDLGLLEEPIVLGSKEYFVLGDDRENSEDSRSANIGNVKSDEIFGKVWMVKDGK